MRETLIFILGVIVGSGGLYALYSLYNWIDNLKKQIDSLRWELHHLTIQRDLWTEFNFWKSEKKKDDNRT